MSIYLYKNNQQIGPFEESIVIEMLRSGRVSANDLAFKAGMSDWQPLGTVIPIENIPLPTQQMPPPNYGTPQNQQQFPQSNFGASPNAQQFQQGNFNSTLPNSQQFSQPQFAMNQTAFSQASPASFPKALADLHGFTFEELGANQQGKMSDRQKSKLKFTGGFGCLGIVLVIGVLCLLGTLMALVNTGRIVTGPLMIGLLLVVVSGAIGLWAITKMREYKVESYEGYIEKVIEQRRNYSSAGGLIGVLVIAIIYGVTGWDKSYYYKLDRAKLKVPKRSFDSLDDANLYRVYYSGYPKKLLSFEISPRNNPEKTPFKLTLLE